MYYVQSNPLGFTLSNMLNREIFDFVIAHIGSIWNVREAKEIGKRVGVIISASR